MIVFSSDPFLQFGSSLGSFSNSHSSSGWVGDGSRFSFHLLLLLIIKRTQLETLTYFKVLTNKKNES